MTIDANLHYMYCTMATCLTNQLFSGPSNVFLLTFCNLEFKSLQLIAVLLCVSCWLLGGHFCVLIILLLSVLYS